MKPANQSTDSGLTPHVSRTGVWAFALGTSIGWGSLVVTANTYLSQAGPMGTTLGLIIGGFIMLLIARCYSYLISCYPDAGGSYAFVRESFGYDHGFLTSWFLLLTYLAMLWANATSLPLFAHYLLGDFFRFGRLYTLFGYDVYLGEALLSMAVTALLAWLIVSVRHAAYKLMIAMAVFFSLAIAACFLVCIFGSPGTIEPAFLPEGSGFTQSITIACMSPWAFIGFEMVSHASEEYKFPRIHIFRVLVITIVSITVLYIFVTFLSVTAWPPQYHSWLEYIRDLGNIGGIEGIPAFYAVRHYLGRPGLYILGIVLLCLILTSLIGNLTALSRLLYSLGKERIVPVSFGRLNKKGIPSRAILAVACISMFIPFLGRTSIGWIVDVTTIGATIIYGFICASAMKTARKEEARKEWWIGLSGLILMLLLFAWMLLPNLFTESSMSTETFFLFGIWAILGFLVFRSILKRDKNNHYGRSVIVWTGLLALVLLVAIIWMRQSMLISSEQTLSAIHEHYQEYAELNAIQADDEQFITGQLDAMSARNTQTVIIATGLFVLSIGIMLSNHIYMNKRTQVQELAANTDALTGVKSKHAYIMQENALNSAISDGICQPFAVLVCDVNGLKYINDTFGHKAGDAYIVSASRLICDLFQHSPVFRIGGDEFTVLLKGRDFENRMDILSHLRSISESHIGTDKVVVSAGVSEWSPQEDTDVHTVFERADALMYQDKQSLKAMGARVRDDAHSNKC